MSYKVGDPKGVVVTVNTVENTILDTIYYEIVKLRDL